MVRLSHDLADELFTPVASGLGDGCLSTAKAVAITRAVDALPGTCARRRTVEVMLDGDGIDIPASALRRICCDAEIIPVVLGGRSEVLDVGRLQQLVTAAIWKALAARDHHCRLPGCRLPGCRLPGCRRPPLMCHAHHVVHWIDGGPTSPTNVLLLRGHHHHLVHSGPWRVRLDSPGYAEFCPPPGATRGRLVSPRPPPRE